MKVKFKQTRQRWACNPFTGRPIISFEEGEERDIEDEFINHLLSHDMIDTIEFEAVEKHEKTEIETEAEIRNEQVEPLEKRDPLEVFTARIDNIIAVLQEKKAINERLELIGMELGVSINKNHKPETVKEALIERFKEVHSDD